MDKFKNDQDFDEDEEETQELNKNSAKNDFLGKKKSKEAK